MLAIVLQLSQVFSPKVHPTHVNLCAYENIRAILLHGEIRLRGWSRNEKNLTFELILRYCTHRYRFTATLWRDSFAERNQESMPNVSWNWGRARAHALVQPSPVALWGILVAKVYLQSTRYFQSRSVAGYTILRDPWSQESWIPRSATSGS